MFVNFIKFDGKYESFIKKFFQEYFPTSAWGSRNKKIGNRRKLRKWIELIEIIRWIDNKKVDFKC